MGAPIKAEAVEFRPKDRPTEKQHAFTREYLSNGRKAGLAYAKVYAQNFDGTNVTLAYQRQGEKYLRHPKIKKMLAEAEAKVHAVTLKVFDKYAITQERVLEELARIAFSNQTDLVSWTKEGVVVKDSADLTDAEKAAITEVTEYETKTGKKIKVK